VLSCDDVPAEPLEPTRAAVGIDLGVTSYLTTSNGAHLPNPRLLAATAGRLAVAQRGLAGKKRGGSPRKKAVAKVARLHGKVRRQCLDHAHKTALALIRDYDLIVHEDLKIANMIRRPKPRPDDSGGHQPNGAAAKAGLNKSINDAGWGTFLRILSAKAESAGRTVIAVDPRHTSQRCAQCGHTAAGPRHPGGVPMSGLRPPGPRRRQRRAEHSEGRACPPGGIKLPGKPLPQEADESAEESQ
jgi:putative transposase